MRLEKKHLVYLLGALSLLFAFGQTLGIFESESSFDRLSSANEIKVIKSSASNLELDKEASSQEKKGETIMVHIAGEVLAPGVYELEAGKRVIHAIELAKPKPTSDINLLNLARVLTDGEKIIVPTKNGTPHQKNEAMPQAEDKISLNKAQKSELMTLPSIGDKRSEDIIAYRESHGGFKSVEELKEVSGIGEKTYEKLKDEVTP